MICAQIQRGLFLRALQLLQPCENFRGGHRYQRGAVAQRDRHQAELHAHRDEQHEQRKSGDDAGKNQRQQHQSAEQLFAGEIRAVQRQRGRQTQSQRDRHGHHGNDHAVPNRLPQRAVPEKLAIPVECPVRGRKTANTGGVERINHQNNNRKIQERINEKCVDPQQQRRPPRRESAVHETASLFSSRSVMNSSETTSSIMQKEIAAPSGQL